MAQTTSRKYLPTLSTLVATLRKVTHNPSKTVRDVGSAGARCHKTFEFLEKCSNSGWMTDEREFKEPPLLFTAVRYCIVKLEQANRKNTAAQSEIDEYEDPTNWPLPTDEEIQRAIEQLNDLSREIAEFICSQSECSCLEELDEKEMKGTLDPGLTKVPEVKLWWMASFGPKNEIPWKDFWAPFSDYMADVYGYPIDTGDENNVEGSIQSCLGKGSHNKDSKGWTFDEDIKVSMADFRMFYQRFGPWDALYLKTIPLTDYGSPLYIFYPTNVRRLANTYLAQNVKDVNFIVRYSSRAGNLVYQRSGVHVLIKNGISGYHVVSEGENARGTYKDIPDALEDLDAKTSRMTDTWISIDCVRDRVANMSSASKYAVVGPSKEEVNLLTEIKDTFAGLRGDFKEGMGELKEGIGGVKDGVDSLSKKIDFVFDTVMMMHLESLKGHVISVPSVFYLVPSDLDSTGESDEKAGLKNWDVHILCEGELKTDPGGKKYFECHDADDIQIHIPNGKLADNIMLMRVGIQFAKMAIGVAGSDVVPCGPVVSTVSDALGLQDKLDKADRELSKLREQYDIVNEIGEQELQQSREQLRALLMDKKEFSADLDDGKCGQLTQMWNKNSSRLVWVCEKHGTDDYGNIGPVTSDQPTHMMKSNTGIKTSYLLTVTCIRGKNLPNVEKHSAKGDVSDPFVRITPWASGKKLTRKKTKKINNNLNPKWNATITWKEKKIFERVLFEVFDHNYFKSNFFIGRCQVDMRKPRFEGGIFYFGGPRDLVGDNGEVQGAILISVKCHPV